MSNKKIEDYKPMEGFYDLRDLNIPKAFFIRLWKVQIYLFNVERNRQHGIIHPQIKEIQDFSAKYQQALLSFTQTKQP